MTSTAGHGYISGVARRESSSKTGSKTPRKKTAAFVPAAEEPKNQGLLSFHDTRLKTLILLVIGLAFYANAINHEFALDDGIVIENNIYVLRGLAGIKDILTHDSHQAYYEKMRSGQHLAGGRFRPLSQVTFALEQELIGTFPAGIPAPQDWDLNKNGRADPGEDLNKDGLLNARDSFLRGAHARHGVNVVLYVLSVLLLFHWLHTFLVKDHPDVAFFTSLLFLIHPLHTEVVANIKSRDEILCFLFTVLTLLSISRYVEWRRIRSLWISWLFFILALLSKEYAVSLLGLIPIMLYVFYARSPKKIIRLMLPFVVISLIYMAWRLKFAGLVSHVPQTDIFSNPYLLADGSQKAATIIYVWLRYLKLLFVPFPLSSDYSYRQIAYRDFADIEVWISLAVHLMMVVYAVRLILKRHPSGFALAFYLANLALVGNLFFSVGATMGERLIYHSSLGFSLAAAWGLVRWLEKWPAPRPLKRYSFVGVGTAVCILFGILTIERNADWENDVTLFLKDVRTVPESAMVNCNAGSRYVEIADWPANDDGRTELLEKAVRHLTKALSIYPKYENACINLGLAEFKLGRPDRARANWDRARELNPRNPYLETCFRLLTDPLMKRGIASAREGQIETAIESFKKAVKINSADPDLWYSLGGAYALNNQYGEALECFRRILRIDPDHEKARNALRGLDPAFKK